MADKSEFPCLVERDLLERRSVVETGIPRAARLIVEAVAAFAAIDESGGDEAMAPAGIDPGIWHAGEPSARQGFQRLDCAQLVVGVDQRPQHRRLIIRGQDQSYGSLLGNLR